MTAGTEPAITAEEWLSGINRGTDQYPVCLLLICLCEKLIPLMFLHTDPVLMSLKEGYTRPNQLVFKAPVKEKKSVVVNGIDLLENVPPRTENEVCKPL